MSFPSSSMRPAVTWWRPVMQRASVDLPQPDSPTMPSVSPCRTSRETPSTAWTRPISFLTNRPSLIGKYLRTSVTLSTARLLASGGHLGADADEVGREPAGRAVLPARQRRLVDPALGHDVAAPRVEGAGARRVDQARRLPGHRLEPGLVAGRARHRLQQADRVGMVRGVVERAAVGVLDRLTRVHHQDV